MARNRDSLRRSSSSIQSRAWAWRSRLAAKAWISRTGECRSSACISCAVATPLPLSRRNGRDATRHSQNTRKIEIASVSSPNPRKPISWSRSGASMIAAGMLAATSQFDRLVWA